jgi:biotin synthase
MMTDFQEFAEKALRDEVLTRPECLAVLRSEDEVLHDLLQAAFKVREHYFGRKVRLQMLLNAKSGACQEDCHYCSQSSVSTADIDRYGLLPRVQMVEGARRGDLLQGALGAMAATWASRGRSPYRGSTRTDGSRTRSPRRDAERRISPARSRSCP